MAESFAELFAESVKDASFEQGVVKKAKVIDIIPDFVILYADGSKSESYVPVAEFKDDRGELEVAVGDEVDVYLESFENGMGKTIFSREKAKRLAAWERLEEAFANGDLVTGRIIERVRGGFTVEIDKIKAFLPGSLVDTKPVKDISNLEQQDLDFKVIKVDRAQNNIVVSRRAALMAADTPERNALLEKLAEGTELVGVVKNLTDYGAFVDLGGIDGLLHITDISWRRIRHPSEVFHVGDEIRVKVLKYDKERCRVSLGLKQLVEDPWKDIGRRYPVGTRIFGKVTNITDYGCFVEIEEGIEGLVHMSELSWTNRNLHPSKVVVPGQEVEVMVLELDAKRRRISLGIKQCLPNPWKEFAANHSKGEVVKGAIKSITDFGIFVGLDGDIDGLVHLSDLSWSEPGEKVIRIYRKNQEVEALILAVDADRERISLGIKQLAGNADESELLAEMPKGSVVGGTVTEVDAKYALVDLGNGIVGRVRAADVSRERVHDVNEWLKVGNVVEAKVMGADKTTQTVNISIKELQPQLGSSGAPSNTRLGDLLKEQIGLTDEQDDEDVQ